MFCKDWLWQAGWAQTEGMMRGGGGLMLLDAIASLEARSEKLEAQKVDIEVSIKDLLAWLDEIWLSGDLTESMTEEEYLEFRKAIEESGF